MEQGSGEEEQEEEQQGKQAKKESLFFLLYCTVASQARSSQADGAPWQLAGTASPHSSPYHWPELGLQKEGRSNDRITKDEIRWGKLAFGGVCVSRSQGDG